MTGTPGPNRRQMLAGLGAWVARDAAAAKPVQPLLLGDGTNRDFVLPLLQLIADGGGFEWELRFVPWLRLLAELNEGSALAWGLSRNAEREQALEFSDVVFTNHLWLVERADRPSAPPGVAGLAGRRLCKRRGVVLGPPLDTEVGRSFQVIESALGYDSALRMLLAGRCDGVLFSHRSADPALVHKRLQALMPDDATRLAVGAAPLNADAVYFAAARHHPALAEQLQRVNQGLRAQARAIQALVISNA